MTSFLIATNTTSTTAQTLNGFESGVVGPGALLATSSGTAITMIGTTPFLTVLGNVHIAFGTRAVGNDGATTVSSANIYVGATGAITSPVGDGIGLTYTGLNFNLSNDGLISGNVAVRLAGSATALQRANIVNNGTISSNADAITTNSAVEDLLVTNTGTIQAGFGRVIQHAATGGVLSVVNTGTILSSGTAVETLGNLLLSNSGTIMGNVQFGDTGTIRNTGLIDGNISDIDTLIDPNSPGMVVRNGGTITGDVNFRDGDDTFIDLGGSIGGTVFGGAGNDTYFIQNGAIRIADVSGVDDVILTTVNYRITNGIEHLFADTQTGLRLLGSGGTDRITGNVGNDTISGGGGNDTLTGQSGDDDVFGGFGNDLLTGSDAANAEANRLFGGGGNDTFVWLGAAGRLSGGSGRDLLTFGAVGALGVDVDLAAGTARTGTLTVVLSEIEDANGTANNDTLDGSTLGNLLNGLAGDDTLAGLGGNDTLVGGAGRDSLTGGTGVDTFVFRAVAHSAIGAPDLITGFDTAGERINLAAIDANAAVGGDDAFAFIGTAAFAGTGAQVRYFRTDANQTIVRVRLAGDAVTDMEIELSGLLTLNSGDFVL